MFSIGLRLKYLQTILLVTILLPHSCLSETVDYYKAERDLIESLQDGYNSNIRPKIVKNGTWNSEVFDVHLVLSLYALRGIDEIEETMSTSMVITLVWKDPKLSWDPADHHNITGIYLKASEVWRPLWFVGNSVEMESGGVASKEWVPIHYSFKGQAIWQDRLPLQTSCDVDTTFYPFDRQSCSVLLHWFDYEINIKLAYESEHLDDFQDNAMWELYNYTLHTQREYPDFRVTYYFFRKPGHTIYNLLFPVMMIALLGPLVFLLPAESGERTGYIITVLLSVSVYMIIISEQLPRSSNPMSLLTYVLFAWYVLCALIVVVVVIGSKIYSFSDSKPVPKLAKLLVKLLRCKCSKGRRRIEKENGVDESVPCVTNGNGNAHDRTHGPDDDITWATVGRAIDKTALIVFYLLKLSFIVVFAMILNMKNF